MNKLEKTDSKPRAYSDNPPNYEVCDCPDAGGKYQELKGLGSFTEVVDGSRVQRLHDRNYCKEVLSKKPNPDGMGLPALSPDTRGPPHENTSVPKRVF